MLKRVLWVVVLLAVGGCASTVLPTYVQDRYPYTQRFYAGFAEALTAVTDSLQAEGWRVEEELDPRIYEHSTVGDLIGEQRLLITAVRTTPRFWGARYTKMNIYLRSGTEVVEVEFRYLRVTATWLKSLTSYRNDAAIARLFARIDEALAGRRVR